MRKKTQTYICAGRYLQWLVEIRYVCFSGRIQILQNVGKIDKDVTIDNVAHQIAKMSEQLQCTGNKSAITSSFHLYC
mgnify:CR=1 FL=1